MLKEIERGEYRGAGCLEGVVVQISWGVDRLQTSTVFGGSNTNSSLSSYVLAKTLSGSAVILLLLKSMREHVGALGTRAKTNRITGMQCSYVSEILEQICRNTREPVVA